MQNASTATLSPAADLPVPRVEIPAHFDSWMAGDRFGTVVKKTRSHVHVRMDRSGKTLRIAIETLDSYGRTL